VLGPLAAEASGGLEQLRMASPADTGAFDAEPGVAVALAGEQRVDDVERPLRAGGVAGLELLPDETPEGAKPDRAQLRDLVELVVRAEEGRLERVLAGPALDLLGGDRVVRGLGHPGLVPDVVALDQARLRGRGLGGTGEDVGLVPELVERRAQVAADDRLAAV